MSVPRRGAAPETAIRIAGAGDLDGDPVALTLSTAAGTPERIGITGHSDLTAASLPLVAAALRGWLITAACPPWVGVSCLVGGTDRLFAWLALEAPGWRCSCRRARKVEPADAAEFDRLLAAATLGDRVGL